MVGVFLLAILPLMVPYISATLIMNFDVLMMASTAVTYIDSSAVQALRDLYHEYKSRGIQIVIANPKKEVLITLTKAGLVDLIGKEWYFVRVHDAVQVCLQHVQGGINELPRVPDSIIEGKRSFLQRSNLGKEETTVDLETGQQTPSSSSTSSDNLQLQEPLLPRRSS